MSRLRVLVAVLAVAAIASASLTLVAVDRTRDAQRSATRVRAAELTSASVASLQDDPQRSLLLALHAVDIITTLDEPIPVDTVASLHWAVQAAGVPYPPDPGRAVAVAGPDGLQGVYDLPLDELVSLASGGLTRPLTDTECARYLGGSECALPGSFPPLAMAGSPFSPEDPARPLAGTSVVVMGPWSGGEAAGLDDELARFTDSTGIEATYLGIEDLGSVLPGLEPHERGDINVFAQPGGIMGMARDGSAIDMSGFVDTDRLSSEHSPYLVRLMTKAEDGTWPSPSGGLYGIPIRLNVKSLIWYPVPEFEAAGYELPETWDQLIALSDQMVRDGRTPWCWGEGAGGATGWPATDWIEDIVLHESGPEVYDRWVAGELSFQSAPVRSAFEHLGEVAFADGYVADGIARGITLGFMHGQEAMFLDPPGCWLYRQASFIRHFFPAGTAVGTDVGNMPFPAMSEEGSEAVLGGADFATMSRDRPEVRELISFFRRSDFGVEWAKTGMFLSSHRGFDVDAYVVCDVDGTCLPDLEAQAYGEQIAAALKADAFRFDGSDLMDDAGQWMWTGMIDYLTGGLDSLDEVLANLDDEEWRLANR